MQDQLLIVQPTFKADLLESVTKFQADVKSFSSDYEVKGPNVSGILPAEASDRLEVSNHSNGVSDVIVARLVTS